ncbi:MAG: hypothetical protein JXD18_14925 [Anaerolineae bacterium]|nr:hypothetical protein [Anaerolineae bacterium]
MNRYTALDKKGHPIVTVGAESEREARERIRQQLDREGRRDFYKLWVAGGRRIRRHDDE